MQTFVPALYISIFNLFDLRALATMIPTLLDPVQAYPKALKALDLLLWLGLHLCAIVKHFNGLGVCTHYIGSRIKFNFTSFDWAIFAHAQGGWVGHILVMLVLVLLQCWCQCVVLVLWALVVPRPPPSPQRIPATLKLSQPTQGLWTFPKVVVYLSPPTRSKSYMYTQVKSS